MALLCCVTCLLKRKSHCKSIQNSSKFHLEEYSSLPYSSRNLFYLCQDALNCSGVSVYTVPSKITGILFAHKISRTNWIKLTLHIIIQIFHTVKSFEKMYFFITVYPLLAITLGEKEEHKRPKVRFNVFFIILVACALSLFCRL